MNRLAQSAQGDLSTQVASCLKTAAICVSLAHIFILISFQVLAPLRRGSLFIPHQSALAIIDLATVSGRYTSRPALGERWPSQLVRAAGEKRLNARRNLHVCGRR